eukprot:TRINITY_DN6886_c0_g1_i15.p1 TRINITY_DN6886_c0_g1~~TRINITY_DN6886_c0_g1_i15.p1  ORF type:complete len:373 (+),score=61.10 TRINITY_DN6886_c0_g1_i15:931-2049(+)
MREIDYPHLRARVSDLLSRDEYAALDLDEMLPDYAKEEETLDFAPPSVTSSSPSEPSIPSSSFIVNELLGPKVEHKEEEEIIESSVVINETCKGGFNLIEAVRCVGRFSCQSHLHSFSHFLDEWGCLRVPQEAAPTPDALIYYTIDGVMFTAIYEKNAHSGAFMIGKCDRHLNINPHAGPQFSVIEATLSAHYVRRDEDDNKIPHHYKKKLDLSPLVTGNALHVAKPNWRKAYPSIGEPREDERDAMINLQYRINGSIFNLQTPENMPLGFGVVPVKEMVISGAILMCEKGSVEVFTKQEMSSFMVNKQYLEICYPDRNSHPKVADALLAMHRCRSTKRLCFEVAYNKSIHTLCLAPHNCLKWGTPPPAVSS